MTTALDVCNMALALLGEDAISSLSGTEKRAVVVNRAYTSIRDLVLGARDWQFASDWRLLGVSATVPESPRFTQLIAKPSDCIAVREVVDSYDKPLEWAMGEDGILLDDAATDAASAYTSAEESTAAAAGTYGSADLALSGTPDSLVDYVLTVHLGYRYGLPAAGAACLEFFLDGQWIGSVRASDAVSAGSVELDTIDTRLSGLTLTIANYTIEGMDLTHPVYGYAWKFATGSAAGARAYVRLTKQVTDPTAWPGGFQQAVAARLAAACAIPLTQNQALHDRMMAVYERELRAASQADGIQGRTMAPRPAGGGFLSQARRG